MKLHILVIMEIIKWASPEELAPGGGLCHSLSVSEAEAQDSDWGPATKKLKLQISYLSLDFTILVSENEGGVETHRC